MQSPGSVRPALRWGHDFALAKAEGVRVALEVAAAKSLAAEMDVGGPPFFLPESGTGQWVAPVSVLRSALFSARGRGPREHLKSHLIAAQGSYEIRFTGERLNQEDLDLWLLLLDHARFQPAAGVVKISGAGLLSGLGLKDGGTARKDLFEALIRLRACAVVIRQGSGSPYIGGLVERATPPVKENPRGRGFWEIRVDPRISDLFEPGYFQALSSPIRLALRGKPLAAWLYGYYSSRQQPHPLRVATVRELCGSTSVELRSFTQVLRRALDTLHLVCGEHGQKFVWSLEHGVLSARSIR